LETPSQKRAGKLRTTSHPAPTPSTSARCAGVLLKSRNVVSQFCSLRAVGKTKRSLEIAPFQDLRFLGSAIRLVLPPIREVPTEVETLSLDQVVVTSHVGGLVKSFERMAA
jgi:hypothetical protein